MLSELALSRVGQANGSAVVAGLWLLVAPFVLGYVELSGPLWNDLTVGAVIALVALLRIGAGLSGRTQSRAFALLGARLIFAPLVLGYAGVEHELARGADVTADGTLVTVVAETASWNDVLVGLAVLVLAARSAGGGGLPASALAAPAREFARRRGQ